MTKKYKLHDEINTKFPDNAIYASFRRILGNYRNWRYRDSEQLSDIKKNNTFSFELNGNKFPLYVEVFPYKDGSKVTYSTNIAYNIDSSGQASLTKIDIKNIKKQIEKIIND